MLHENARRSQSDRDCSPVEAKRVRSVSDAFTLDGEKIASNLLIETDPRAAESSTVAFPASDLGGGLDKPKDVNFTVEVIKLPEISVSATYDVAL